MSEPHEPAPSEVVDKLGDLAARSAIRRVNLLAWRDLDDPEAGGSEVHASTVAGLWGQAGIEVTMRTSYAAGHPSVVWRDGYRVIRKAGRYLVFPRAVVSELMGWHGERDALVEIWNGMPWFSPVWARGPRAAWLHHWHSSMWHMTLPPRLARGGAFVEARVAPPLYRRTPIVTLSESSKRELVEHLGFRASRVTVVPPGVDPRFAPGGERSATPLVVAVGRLVPVKRFHLLVEALATVRERMPTLRAVIVGDGYEREALERRIRDHDASEWLTLPGRLTDDELVDVYRRAWVLASASAHEGWGMTITEAAACGTPAVATRIAGHADAIVHERTGLLVDDPEQLASALARVLADDAVRQRLGAAAREHAARFTWGATAYRTLDVLARQTSRHARR
ncbi:MAG TPA: glycosyltransferase family 4 protein [Acidimicrobiia bacterium]|nr:glycosyltransferase family 4 protein [Acidimicrobiia bacterium]